jgi:hypothetical protein
MPSILTPRWTTLKPHGEQLRLWTVDSRFRVVPSGRRSGKTELAKRYGVIRAISHANSGDGWYVYAAPTHMQAKRIFWRDLKALVPRQFMRGRPSESELTIRLLNGAEITVLGLDAPERIEGRSLDWICCDEFANMKPEVWSENIRPALSTLGRPGAAWFIGVPEGRNHYYHMAMSAMSEKTAEWTYHAWPSSDILDPEEIEAAKRDLDELTYAQEFEASFVNFQGRAYHPFSRDSHCATLEYQPRLPLALCFDFNVSPGVAVICQEQEMDGDTFTAVIGEIYIPRHSNTPAVCRKIVKEWGHHKGDVLVHGDATGGAAGTAQVRGSDWDIIRQELKPVFKERFKMRVPRSNPRERVRVNAVNARLRTADGKIHLRIDPDKAPMCVLDTEGVILLEGGSGELDKKHDPALTHLTDALGYYIEKAHKPLARIITRTTPI